MNELSVSEELNNIVSLILEADSDWENVYLNLPDEHRSHRDEQKVEYAIERAYLALLAFLDKHKHSALLAHLHTKWGEIEKDVTSGEYSHIADQPVLRATGILWDIAAALRNIYPGKEKLLKSEANIGIIPLLSRIRTRGTEVDFLT